MLLQFSIKNYKAFKDKAVLSFIASKYDKNTLEDTNIYYNKQFELRLLKSAVIYGANASGKTKLVEAIGFMRNFVLNNLTLNRPTADFSLEPFVFNDETEKEPSEFEIIFIYKKKQYRYGFEVTRDVVVSEWLYYKPKVREVRLFYRDQMEFDMHGNSFTKGRAVVKQQLVSKNALLLTVAAKFNDETSIDVLEWFERLQVLSGLNEYNLMNSTIKKIKNDRDKEKILYLLKAADLSIEELSLLYFPLSELPNEMAVKLKKGRKIVSEDAGKLLIATLMQHKQYDSNRKVVGKKLLSLETQESSGTHKYFSLLGPIIDTLETGCTLVIDELDSKLHTKLVHMIVSLFNSKLNKKNAQLVFNTHDTNLLSSKFFRRDQIWFADKNRYEEAKLYSLADFKSTEVKKGDSFEEKYLQGKYGGIPYLNKFDELLELILK